MKNKPISAPSASAASKQKGKESSLAREQNRRHQLHPPPRSGICDVRSLQSKSCTSRKSRFGGSFPRFAFLLRKEQDMVSLKPRFSHRKQGEKAQSAEEIPWVPSGVMVCPPCAWSQAGPGHPHPCWDKVLAPSHLPGRLFPQQVLQEPSQDPCPCLSLIPKPLAHLD